jgi:hypothetical protein
MPATTLTTLPRPSKAHATCAWCRTDFGTIVALIDHVDSGHSPITSAERAPRNDRGRSLR